MKKGLAFVLALVVVGGLFAQPQTTITATKEGDKFNVTITWKPAEDYWTQVELRGNYEEGRWGAGRPMTKQPDGTWTITITVPEGSYEYKFFADDTWIDEAENYPQTVGNPFGGVNGAFIANDDLVAGKVTEIWAPKVNFNFNAPVSFRYRDQEGGQAETFLKFAGYMKLHGELLPKLTFFTETNLHGLGSQLDLYKENWTEDQNNVAKLRASSFFIRGLTIFNNHFAELQKLLIQYSTPYVDIAYADGYMKWIPESYAGPFVFTMYGVDATKDNNALLGTWRLMKQGVSIADGVSLDYMVSWGLNARREWDSGAIWDWVGGEPVTDNGSVQGADNSWDDNKAGFLGSANYFQVIVKDVGTFGLNVDFVSETAHRGWNLDVDDFFYALNQQYSVGYKGSFGPASLAFQFATQLASKNLYPNFEYKFGRNSVIGLKSGLDFGRLGVDGLSLNILLAMVGADYQPWRFYATSDEDKAGEYVGSDLSNARITFKFEPKFSAFGLTAGLNYKLQLANPTNDTGDLPATSDEDIYNDIKVYGGYSMDILWANAYANMKYNIYEDTTGKNAFEFNNIGLNLGAKIDIVTLNLYYQLSFDGTGTTVSTDDAMGHSVALSAEFAPSKTNVFAGLNFVGGEANSTVPANQKAVGYSFGVQQGLDFIGLSNIVKYHAFIQYNSGLSVFDGQDQGKIGLSDYRISSAGTGLMTKYDEVILGVWIDY